ncbi:MAG TPA: lipopolysaccharide biosynthesis protein [Chthoniobacterales bacterium]|nr:lipopolysaccharide biosynthesis protein [Chthoniobacterales bacterium]
MRDNPAKENDRHLRVDQLGVDLKQRAVRSGVVVLAGQAAAGFIGITAVAFLARLLGPADFGLIAMAFPAVVIASTLRNFGLDIGAIYRERLNSQLMSALFWLALGLNFLLTLALAAMAPGLAWFYSEPRLVKIMLVFAGAVLVLNLGAQHETLLKRQMRFDILALNAVIAAGVGAGVAIALAFAGAGYWALVAQTSVIFFLRSVLAWVKCGWRPAPLQRVDAEYGLVLRAMLVSGRNLTGTRVLTLFSNYFDRITVGWLAGPAILGLYENGRRLAFFALDTLYFTLLDVAVAGFSRTAGDNAQYRVAAIKAVQMTLAVMLPCLAFLLVEMRPATLLVLGDRWLPAVPYAQLLILAAFAQSLSRTLVWFYLSRDETERQVRWMTIQTTVILAAVAIGAWLGGPHGVALGLVCATWGLTIPAIVYGLQNSPFTAMDFAFAAARPVLLSLGVAASLFVIETAKHWSWSPLTHCAVATLIYSLTYVGGWVALPGGSTSGIQMIRLLCGALGKRPGLNAGQVV